MLKGYWLPYLSCFDEACVSRDGHDSRLLLSSITEYSLVLLFCFQRQHRRDYSLDRKQGIAFHKLFARLPLHCTRSLAQTQQVLPHALRMQHMFGRSLQEFALRVGQVCPPQKTSISNYRSTQYQKSLVQFSIHLLLVWKYVYLWRNILMSKNLRLRMKKHPNNGVVYHWRAFEILDWDRSGGIVASWSYCFHSVVFLVLSDE